MGWRRSWYSAFRVSIATTSTNFGLQSQSEPNGHSSQPHPIFHRSKAVACEGGSGSSFSNLLSSSRRGTASERNAAYDFIIIGHGRAGQAALARALALCPQARIGVVDPFLVSAAAVSTGGKRNQYHRDVDFYPGRSIGISPRNRYVLVEPSSALTTNDDEDVDMCLTYKYGVLLATGSHGAPPPHYLMDAEAHDRVMELRPTTLPTTTSATRSSPHDQIQQIQSAVTTDQSTVAILGSGWDAMELAAQCTFASTKRRNNRPVLIMGASGPVAHILPSYLSAALTKRWRSKGVQVLDRSLVRYIAHSRRPRDAPEEDEDPTVASESTKRSKKRHQQAASSSLQIYTAKSYDFLDGTTTAADYIILAPSTHGPHGSATLPTHDVPEYLWSSTKGRSWYQTWSQLSAATEDDDNGVSFDAPTPSILSCYQDDGRIVVNAELCAASYVYAAGSVAKAPNPLTGHATVTSTDDAGPIAAYNMTRAYRREQQQSRFLSSMSTGASNDNPSHHADTLDPINILRSDQRLVQDGKGGTASSCLARLGVQALCVGNCDSDMATHAIWWTNQAAQRRLLRARNTRGGGNEAENHNPRQQQQQQHRTIKSPVFGIGVVFYLDKRGRIQGIMTWGIPFADPRSGVIKGPLLSLLKTVLRTNGGIPEVVTERDQRDMALFMERTSQQAVLLASSNSQSKQQQLPESLPRPLHRYTDARPVRSSGFLKRKDGGQGFGVNGENLFARSTADHEDVPPPSVPIPVGMDDTTAAAERLKALYDWTVWEQLESRWDENEQRARPTKEDPLWIRKGDETRNVPQRERIAAAYTTLLQGQSNGGGSGAGTNSN